MATSSNQSGFVDSWQRGKSVIECNLHMLETEDFTDVTFLVGSKKQVVRAHRYVLVSRSCVFHAMFCGRMAEQGEITIPDIEVNVFKEFLRFLYTDNCTINTENVAGLLYTARKYDAETLFTQSASFLEQSLSEGNLCEILEKSHGYGETDLEQKALMMLSQAGPKVIESAAFLDLCSKCFGLFLESDELQLKEDQVFEVALSWTKAECEREGLSPSHENMRKVLGVMVYELRFASLSLEFLTKVVGPSKMLTSEERIKIIDRISDKSINISPFKTDARRNIEQALEQKQVVHRVSRFQAVRQETIQAGWYGVSFSTNKDISLLGCQLYVTSPQRAITIDIQIFDDQGVQVSRPLQDMLTLNRFTNDVMFSAPISIHAGREYTICVNLPSSTFYYGVVDRPKVTVAGVEFTFSKSKLSGSISVHLSGQIPGLICQY